MQSAVAFDPAVAEEERMSKRRMIGIDLAWGRLDGGEPAGSGCAELVWKDDNLDKLELTRLCSLGRVKEIVKWIESGPGDWLVAIDAPLIITNPKGSREAEKQVRRCYKDFRLGAHSSNTKRKQFREHYQGRQILKALKNRKGTLVEKPEHLNGKRLFFETYPHPAMIELFGLDGIIKYKSSKKCLVDCQREGQQRLADEIGEHLCERPKSPRLCRNELLDDLLREPKEELKGQRLKRREDLLDAVVCAYIAAWVAKGLRWHALGKEEEGVIVVPDAGRLS